MKTRKELLKCLGSKSAIAISASTLLELLDCLIEREDIDINDDDQYYWTANGNLIDD